MKFNISKLLFAALSFLLVLAACEKQSNPYYANGNVPVLSSSTTTIAAKPSDSLSNVYVLNWTDPKYATSAGTEKYTIQIDSAGRNFSKATSIVVTGVLTDTFTAKQINDIALAYGFSYNTAYNMDVRVLSSYANNNEQLTSNMLSVSVTPYVIPPKVQPPASGELFIVGSATQGGWTNPVPVPSQQFEEIDSVHYGGVFHLIGGQEYLLLPVNTNTWDPKYAVANKSVPGLSEGGSFGVNLNDNIPGPANDGWYSILVDFQQGTFKVTPFTQVLPDSLFIIGDATAWGWNNPVPEPLQAFKRLNSSQFSITVPMIGGKSYLMIPVNGSWTNKFAVESSAVPASGGPFGYNLGSNFNGPAADGTYTVLADFFSSKYTLTSQ